MHVVAVVVGKIQPKIWCQQRPSISRRRRVALYREHNVNADSHCCWMRPRLGDFNVQVAATATATTLLWHGSNNKLSFSFLSSRRGTTLLIESNFHHIIYYGESQAPFKFLFFTIQFRSY